MKYRFGIVILIIFFCLHLKGQPLRFFTIENLDSLESILDTATGTHRAYLLCEKASCISKDPQLQNQVLLDIQEALTISKEYDDPQGLANAYMSLGFLSKGHEKYRESINYLLKADQYLDQIDDWLGVYKVTLGLFGLYDHLGLQDSAEFYIDKALSKLTARELWFCRIGVLSWKINLYSYTNQIEKELELSRAIFDSIMMNYIPNPYYQGLIYLKIAQNLPGKLSRNGFYRESVRANFTIINNIVRFDTALLNRYYYRGKCYGSIAFAYEHWGYYDSAYYYHEKAEAYFDTLVKFYGDKVDYVINLANQLEGKAIVQMKMGQFKKAEYNFTRSLEMREKKNDAIGVAMCLDGMGELYHLSGRYLGALEKYQKALEMKSDYRDRLYDNLGKIRASLRDKVIKQSEVEAYLKLGNLYLDWGNQEIALVNYENSLQLAREIGNKNKEAEALLAMGNISAMNSDQLVPPVKYQEALKLYEQLDNRHGMAQVMKQVADFLFSHKMLNEAIAQYSRTKVVLEELEMNRELAELYADLAKAYHFAGQLEVAEDYYNKSLSIANPLHLLKPMIQSLKGLSELYSKKGSIDSAFSYFQQYINKRDTLLSYENQKMIAEIKEKFETERKDGEIALLKSQNAIQELRLERTQSVLISLGGLALLLIISAVLFIRQERLKLGQKNIILQQKLLRTQMNPHFIFNALTNIQSFMVAKKVEQATGYLTRFSRLLRDILTNSREEQIRLDKEINTIENYLSLQQLRFSNKFDYKIDVQEEIAIEEIMIPPMLAQPFIENAIEHGVRHKKTKGSIRVSFEQVDHHLILEVEDDGVGRKKAKELEKDETLDHLSIATSITTERIDFLRRRHHKRIDMKIVDLFDEQGNACGTRVHFLIPFFN